MSFPTQKQVEVPLLKALEQLGGSAKPQQVYAVVAQQFPQLTKEDLEERLPNSPSTFKWWNLVQWGRQRIVADVGIDGSTRGIWKLTDKGREILGGAVASLHQSDGL